jgi:hypothetical protein
MPTRCFMPPEISEGRLSLACAIWTRSRLCHHPVMALGLALRAAEDLGDGEVDVFVDGQPRQQAVVLEDDGALGAGGVDLAVFQQHGASRHRRQSGDQVEQRGLAAAGMADDRDEFTLVRSSG